MCFFLFMSRSVTFSYWLKCVCAEICGGKIKRIYQRNVTKYQFYITSTTCSHAEIRIVLCFSADINCAQIYCEKIHCLLQGHVTTNFASLLPIITYVFKYTFYFYVQRYAAFLKIDVFQSKTVNMYMRTELSLCMKVRFSGWGYLLPFTPSCSITKMYFNDCTCSDIK